MTNNSKTTAYISGPMTGHENYNFPAFFEAEEKLLKLGFDVVNPARLNPPKPNDVSEQDYWYVCMRRDIKALMNCDSIIMLYGWEKSKGAVIERDLAMKMGMSVLTMSESNELRTIYATGTC